MAGNNAGYLDVKVGYGCNNDCIHCVIRDYESELVARGQSTDCTTRECLDLIASAAARNIGSVTLTGGEPSIRPDFFDLLKACHAAGLKAAVQTNGRAFHSSAFCARLAECGSPHFVVALHGAQAAVHDGISRRSGSFSQTCSGIRNLTAAGYRVTGKLVISRCNAGCLVDTMDLMQSFGVGGACFAYPHGHGHARVHYRELAPRYGEIRPEIDRLTARAAACGFRLSLEAFPLCVLKDAQLVAEFRYLIPGDRRCRPSHMDEFDWDEQRLLDKRKFPACAECSCDRYCEGPWKEYPETYGEDEFRPLPAAALADLLAEVLAMETSG